MATSGSIDFTMTAAQLIKKALVKIGVHDVYSNVNSNVESDAIETLNMILKSTSALRCQNWKVTEAAIILKEDRVKYIFKDKSGSGGQNGVGIAADSLVETTISSDEASGQTTLTITSSSGMASSDVVFIELDDGTRQETTISSVDSSTTITIAAALSSAAASGNKVFTYTPTTDELYFPHHIANVRYRNSNGVDRELTYMSRSDYQAIGDKTTEGAPYCYTIEEDRANKAMYLYPEPSDIDAHIRLDVYTPLEDIDSSSNHIDVPDHWLLALVYMLAEELAQVHNKMDRLPYLQQKAMEYKDKAESVDSDSDYVQFTPYRDY